MTRQSESGAVALQAWLLAVDRVAVALSGGVDSMTLASAAYAALGERAEMYHAVSAAVPAEATRRVECAAHERRWRLNIIDAGEFLRNEYVSNPVNRCFFCKTSLYGAIAPATHAQIVSGTNTDDLGEYRPGLDAARGFAVRHPFVELGFSKQDVRSLARELGLGEIAELPAAPCLASRVETGIAIDAGLLGLVHSVEQMVQRAIAAKTVRCRVRRAGIVIELDTQALAGLSPLQRQALTSSIESLLASRERSAPVTFARYRNGSAFLHAADERHQA